MNLTADLLNSLGVVGLWSVIGGLVLTRKLVWHTDLRECKLERDHWRDIALRGVGIAEQSTTHAELLVEHAAESTP